MLPTVHYTNLNTNMNKTILGTGGKHFAIVGKANVQYLMRMCILQIIREHHWYVISQSFVFIMPGFSTCDSIEINKTKMKYNKRCN